MNAENGSAAEGSSKEYQTEYCTPEPSTGQLRQRKRRRNTKYSSQDYQGSTLNVRCGDVKGVLYKEKLAEGVSQKCIKDSKGKWFTPVEFEASGDRAGWKTWRRSITCKGFPLEKLIEERDLPNPPRKYSRKKRRKNPPRLSHQLAESQSSDDSQETSSATRKRAYQRINVLLSSSSSSSSSPAASPTTPTVICDDNLGGATLSPSSPLSSSRAVPATPQPKCRPSHLTPTVILNRLPSAVSKTSRILLESPQMDPKPALRTLRRNPRLCQNVRVFPLSSILGHAILSGQRRMEQLFRNTLGNRPVVQAKFRDICGHLDGLKRQQKDLLAALRHCSQHSKDLDVVGLHKQMNAILNHQQFLQTSVVRLLVALGVEEPKS